MDMQAYEEALEAIADPTRRRVLELIRPEGTAVGEIASQLPVSQPAVSQHLTVLRRAGLVQVEPVGRRRLYRVNPAGLVAIRAYIDRFWDEVLDAFVQAAKKEEEGDGGSPV